MAISRNTDFLFGPKPVAPSAGGFGAAFSSPGLTAQKQQFQAEMAPFTAFEGNLAQMGTAEAQDLRNEIAQRQYGGGMSAAELQDFESLVGRLEGSKMRQAAQANRARQRDTFAGGLASMMGNF